MHISFVSSNMLNCLAAIIVFCAFLNIFYIQYHIICEEKQFYLLFIFHYGWLLFLFFAGFSWLQLLAQCWIKVVRMDILLLFLTIGGKLSIFHHCYVSCEFFIDPFIRLGICFSISRGFFLVCFNHERLLKFAKWFFCIYWTDHVVLLFIVLT